MFVWTLMSRDLVSAPPEKKPAPSHSARFSKAVLSHHQASILEPSFFCYTSAAKCNQKLSVRGHQGRPAIVSAFRLVSQLRGWQPLAHFGQRRILKKHGVFLIFEMKMFKFIEFSWFWKGWAAQAGWGHAVLVLSDAQKVLKSIAFLIFFT